MKALVNEFRDYARLPASQLRCRSTSTRWSARCSACTARRRSRGACRPSSAEALPAIVGDGTQLRQVIHNLVQNALDAVAEQADGRVRVVTEAARNEGGEVRAVRLIVRRQWARVSPRRCSSARSSPTSRPRRRAPASAWRWSRRSPTSTARASASPTSAHRRRRRRRGGGQRARRASFAIIFETRRRRSASPRTSRVATYAGALRVHGHHSCRRRRTGHSGAAVGDPRRRRPHDRAGGERGAGARLPRAHPPRPRPARHLDARRRRHHAAEGMGLDARS